MAALADKVAEEKAFIAKRFVLISLFVFLGSMYYLLVTSLPPPVSVDAALLGRARAVERLRAKTGVIASEAEAVMEYVRDSTLTSVIYCNILSGTSSRRERREKRPCWV